MKLIVICGATATGKSGLALELAQRLDTGIISADSRQVYREFDIGTAKPTKTEQQLVTHYLIDICDPTETMTVGDFQEQAQTLLNNSEKKPQNNYSSPPSPLSPPPPLSPSPPLLVGGTGLYIKSIVQGMKIPKVAPQLELRTQLESLGQNQLYNMLRSVDPLATQKIHSNDQVRTLRALEVFYITGQPITELQAENPPSYPILQIGLDSDVASSTNRIAVRIEKMIADGLVAEVEYLCQKYGVDLPLLNTLGYQEIKQYLAGEISLDTAKELTVVHTRQFAKRQRTWFKAYPQIEWFDVNNPDLLEKVWLRVQQFIDNL
ncbi:MAG: tRNA (adenosine(37)-N6)-dimethylallyltransferase MiaA [Scytonematopsis contorta HA4267-MV1]|jgi:tRNA dimethylallyltransferase|nr:tRNA (adenosine(37)-N6)-dimethylallyltransferase MiaA [Scytonematopsis contorta HA4267-MV1]